MWDGWQMIGVRNGAGEHLERRYHYPWIDGIRSKSIGSSTTPQAFYFKDHLGSITEEKGYNVSLKRFRYDSFGNTVYEQDGTRYEEIRFTGREYFPEMGLYYFRNRWYNPRVGRFVSEDPARIAIMQTALHGWLLYSYGKNNPVFYRDSMGLQVCVTNADGVEYCCVDTPFGTKCSANYPPDYKPSVSPKCRECKTKMGECLGKCISKYNPWWTVPTWGVNALASKIQTFPPIINLVCGKIAIGTAILGVGSSYWCFLNCGVCTCAYD